MASAETFGMSTATFCEVDLIFASNARDPVVVIFAVFMMIDYVGMVLNLTMAASFFVAFIYEILKGEKMRKHEELSDAESCLNRAKDDEMVFVLLGRDITSVATIRTWISERIFTGKNKSSDAQIVKAEEIIAGLFMVGDIVHVKTADATEYECRVRCIPHKSPFSGWVIGLETLSDRVPCLPDTDMQLIVRIDRRPEVATCESCGQFRDLNHKSHLV